MQVDGTGFVLAGRSEDHYGATQQRLRRRVDEGSQGVGKKSKGSKRSKDKDRSSSLDQLGHDEARSGADNGESLSITSTKSRRPLSHFLMAMVAAQK
jgi:hypothetical protein